MTKNNHEYALFVPKLTCLLTIVKGLTDRQF